MPGYFLTDIPSFLTTADQSILHLSSHVKMQGLQHDLYFGIDKSLEVGLHGGCLLYLRAILRHNSRALLLRRNSTVGDTAFKTAQNPAGLARVWGALTPAVKQQIGDRMQIVGAARKYPHSTQDRKIINEIGAGNPSELCGRRRIDKREPQTPAAINDAAYSKGPPDC